MRSILLVDNFDSFAHNLGRYFVRLGHAVETVRNDRLDLPSIRHNPPLAMILSPGPCAPQQAGKSLELVRQTPHDIPLLGICLGHQILAEAAGGKIVRAHQPLHGQSSPIFHDEQAEFTGLPCPFDAARYHSLIVDRSTLPKEYYVSAHTSEGEIMAIRHRNAPRVGWQFHPESVLTHDGFRLCASFLRWAHLPSLHPPVSEVSNAAERPSRDAHESNQVVTF